MKLIRALDGILARAETILLVTFLGAMVVMAFLQVVLRNVFGTGLLWGDTLVRHMLLWAGFLGGALAAFEERHISIDALTKYLSPRIKHVAALITNSFAAVVCFFSHRPHGPSCVMKRRRAGSSFFPSPDGRRW